MLVVEASRSTIFPKRIKQRSHFGNYNQLEGFALEGVFCMHARFPPDQISHITHALAHLESMQGKKSSLGWLPWLLVGVTTEIIFPGVGNSMIGVGLIFFELSGRPILLGYL